MVTGSNYRTQPKNGWVGHQALLHGRVMTTDSLASEFDEAMLEIHRRALAEARYNATRFLGMVSEHGGLETARILIHALTVSEGYTALWERKRLDLTVEAVIINHPKWHPLFTEAELVICRKRLTDYGYQFLQS
jgi:hypothetical protein